VTRPRWLWLVLIAVLVLSVSSTIIMAGLLIYRRHHPFYSGP
jgi:amino acid transporter